MSQHVAVLMGGWSAEREVSLRSGTACAKALEGEGFRVTPIDVGRDIADVLSRLRPDVVLNALHGRVGEDGTVQGILEVLRIPYSHSGVLASALAMQKDKAKLVMAAAGVPVAHGLSVSRFEAARRHILPPPYVVKPVNEGSSVGVIIVREERSHPPQELGREDWAYGDAVLVETFVAGRELTCAVIDGKPTGVIDILPATGLFYDYDAKYAQGGSVHVLPANLKENIYQNVQELALKAHQGAGLPRREPFTDFRYDDTPGGNRRTRGAGSQHAARHDRDLAGARTRGPCRVDSFGELVSDGWWRTPPAIGRRERDTGALAEVRLRRCRPFAVGTACRRRTRSPPRATPSRSPGASQLGPSPGWTSPWRSAVRRGLGFGSPPTAAWAANRGFVTSYGTRALDILARARRFFRDRHSIVAISGVKELS